MEFDFSMVNAANRLDGLTTTNFADTTEEKKEEVKTEAPKVDAVKADDAPKAEEKVNLDEGKTEEAKKDDKGEDKVEKIIEEIKQLPDEDKAKLINASEFSACFSEFDFAKNKAPKEKKPVDKEKAKKIAKAAAITALAAGATTGVVLGGKAIAKKNNAKLLGNMNKKNAARIAYRYASELDGNDTTTEDMCDK